MKHFRHSNRARLLDCTSRSTGMRHAVGEAIYQAIVLVSGHDRSQCTTTKARSRKKAVMAAL